MSMKQWILTACLCAASAVRAVQTAGSLLVDLRPSDLSALSSGDRVDAWTNNGVLGGFFTNAVSGQGAVYSNSVAGAPAVTFDGTANSILVGTAPMPVDLTSNRTWTIEAWVLNPVLSSSVEDYLSWTPRIGGTNLYGTLMEVRYYNTTGLAIEHYYWNVSWFSRLPAANRWHHLAATRDTSGVERMYADGSLLGETALTNNYLRSDGHIVLGGTENSTKTGFENLYSGFIGKLRIHNGTLSYKSVVENYLEERGAYGVTSPADAIWTGTPGETLSWSDTANWFMEQAGADGGCVAVTNGGIAVLTQDAGTLVKLSATNGGLVMSNGASLVVSALNGSLYMGNGSGRRFDFTLADGTFRLLGSNANNLYVGANGGEGYAVIGGGTGTALLEVDHRLAVAQGSSSYGRLTLNDGGAVYVSNEWFCVGSGSGADAKVTVNGGVISHRVAGAALVVADSSAHGVLEINGGQVAPSGNLAMDTSATAATYAAVYLNGGEILARSIYANSPGTNLFYLNGGIIRARESRTDFFRGMTAAYVQSGGARFDIDSGIAVTAAQPLLADPENAGGGLAKYGEGSLTLSGTNTFTGDVHVEAGDLWFRNTNGLAGYAGTIVMTNAAASIGYEKTDGAAELLARMPTDSIGRIMLFPANTNDTVDFAAYPNLSLAFGQNVSYTGTFIPYNNHYVFEPVGQSNVFASVISGTSRVEVNGASDGWLELSGDSSYTGGTVINGGRVIVSHANALGVSAGSPDIAIHNGAELVLNAADLPGDFIQRVTPDSQGYILIGAVCTNVSVDLTGRPGLIVGTDQGTLNYNGAITPAADTYRLGGGGVAFRISSYQGLVLTNLTDGAGGAPRKVVAEASGITRLGTGNVYSGGTSVTNGGAIYLMEDGLGAIPAAPAASNLYVSGGTIRSGDSDFSLAATRGLAVGADGMELHPWSMRTMKVLGDLSGEGVISSTDSGSVFFGGTNNTWGGTLDIQKGTLGAGAGDTFSWNRDAMITGGGGSFGIDINRDLTWSEAFAKPLGADGASLGLRKLGAGTLTVDVSPTYAYTTSIEGGTLKAGSMDAIPSGSGKGVVSISSGAQLDINGLNLAVNGLAGDGTVMDSAGTATAVTVGVANASATFAGAVAPELTLVKTGSGTQSLAEGVAVKDVAVFQGTLALANAAAVTGTVSLASSTVLSLHGYGAYAETNGLLGLYYDLTPATTQFETLALIDALLDPRTPSLVVNSLSAGTTFDFGGTGTLFPEPYNDALREHFAVRWIGKFLAETAGDYTFGTKSDDGSLVFVDGELVVNSNYMQGYSVERSGTVSLTAGLHDIIVVFYESGGQQGLTVYLTAPGGSKQVLPQSLLYPPAAARIAALTGPSDSTVSFASGAALEVGADADATFAGRIIGTNAPVALAKCGSGTWTLTSGSSSFTGQTTVAEGSLALVGAGTFGAFSVGAEALLTVTNAASGMPFPYVTTSGTGLPGAYYDFVPSSYTMYNSQATLEAYLSAYTPNLVAGSDLAGTNFSFGSTGNFFPGTYASTSVFQAYWKGLIDIPVDGTYTFYTASDDGSMLFIDGAVVVNNNYLQGISTSERSGTVTLTAGAHAIALAFYDNGGGWGFYANIAGPGISKRLIPNRMLHPAASSIGSLSGAGAVNLLAGGSILKIDEQVDSIYAGGASGPTNSAFFKTGTGTLTLTGDNDAFLGTWYLLDGALVVGDGGTSGTLGGSSVIASDGTSLTFNRSDDMVYTGAISGKGLICSTGTGMVTLDGDMNAYSGMVQIASGQTLGLGRKLADSVTVTNSGTLVLTGGSCAMSETGIIGDGATRVADGAWLYLSNSLAFPNPLVLAGGGLSLPWTGDVSLSDLAVCAGGVSRLALGVTTNGQSWTIDAMTLETGASLQVGVCGLWGKYYDITYNTVTISNALETFETAVNYFAAMTPALSASSCERGEIFDFGSDTFGTNGLACFPGKYYSLPGNKVSSFGVLWQGGIRIAEAGTYMFATTSDDNSMLYVDGQVVANNNGNHGMQTRSGTIELAAGLHDITIAFIQGGGGYGLYVDITFPGAAASQRLPNAMLVPEETDLPAYALQVNGLTVTNGPGTAAVSLAGDGTLRLRDLRIDTGAKLSVTGAVAAAGSELTATIPAEVPYGVTVLGDFAATDGLDVSGVSLIAIGTEGSLRYRDKKLYIVRNNGMLLIMQ